MLPMIEKYKKHKRMGNIYPSHKENNVADNKTKPTQLKVSEFIAGIEDKRSCYLSGGIKIWKV